MTARAREAWACEYAIDARRDIEHSDSVDSGLDAALRILHIEDARGEVIPNRCRGRALNIVVVGFAIWCNEEAPGEIDGGVDRPWSVRGEPTVADVKDALWRKGTPVEPL